MDDESMSVEYSIADSEFSSADSGSFQGPDDWSCPPAPVYNPQAALESPANQIFEAQHQIDTEMTQTDQMLIDQFNTGDMAQHEDNGIDILQLLAGTEPTTDSGGAANVWTSPSPSVPDYSYPALSPAPQPHAGPNHVQYLPAHTYPYPPPNVHHPIQYQYPTPTDHLPPNIHHPTQYQYPMPTDHPPPNVHHPIQYQYPTPMPTDHPSVRQSYHPYPGYAYDGPHGPPIPTYVYVPPQTTQAPSIGRISQMYMPYSPRTQPQGSAHPFSGFQAKNIASGSQPSNFRTTNLAGGTHPSSFCNSNLAGTQAPSSFRTTNLTGISHLSSFATTSAQPPQSDRPSKSSMTGDKDKANDAHSSFTDHGTGDKANEVIISDSSFVDHSFKTRTETSGKTDASDPSSLKHYLANGWVNWHLVLKSSQRLAYEDLINNILLELTDNWALGLIDHATYMHRKTPVEADCAISPQMLQGIKRYFRRALKADKKKIDAIVMSTEGASLSLAGCDEVELQRRVGMWLGPIHEQYLHVRGENGAIQIPFGHAVVRKGVEVIGYGTRGSDMPIGMGWNKRTGAPVSVFAYVGNLMLSSLMDRQTGRLREIKFDSDIHGPSFRRIYNDAKAAETNECLTAIRKEVCQEGILSIMPTSLPIALQEVYKYKLDSTPEAHRYMQAVARSHCPITRRRSI